MSKIKDILFGSGSTAKDLRGAELRRKIYFGVGFAYSAAMLGLIEVSAPVINTGMIGLIPLGLLCVYSTIRTAQIDSQVRLGKSFSMQTNHARIIPNRFDDDLHDIENSMHGK